MQKNSENFSTKDIMQLAKSPAGRELMNLLRTEHGAAMENVTRSAQEGNMEAAKAALASFLSDPKTRALLQKLQEEDHG